jgi:hypothetical protein
MTLYTGFHCKRHFVSFKFGDALPDLIDTILHRPTMALGFADQEEVMTIESLHGLPVN